MDNNNLKGYVHVSRYTPETRLDDQIHLKGICSSQLDIPQKHGFNMGLILTNSG